MSVSMELPWDARLARKLGETGSAFQQFRDHANLFWTIALVLGFAGLTGVAAQAAIQLPFTPVPITAQVGVVLLAGGFLGRWRGALSQVAYVALGALGAPWFAPAAHAAPFTSGGIAVVESVNGGYLIGFIVAAFVIGQLLGTRPFRSTYAGKLAVLLIGVGIIYLAGALQLAYVLHTDFATTMAFAVVPFVPGDVMKAVLGAGLLAGLALPSGSDPSSPPVASPWRRSDVVLLAVVMAGVWLLAAAIPFGEPSQIGGFTRTAIEQYYVVAAIIATIGVGLAVAARQRLFAVGQYWSGARTGTN
ncbi:MAG: biotin transporter BioY [Thermoplasmata archaeon]|nr:biotin transporter BioY [Thermoplasmata archaeon]